MSVRVTPREQWVEAFQALGFSPAAAKSYAEMTRLTRDRPYTVDAPVRGRTTLRAYVQALVDRQGLTSGEPCAAWRSGPRAGIIHPMPASPPHQCRVLATPWDGVYGTHIESARHYRRHSHTVFGIGLMEHGAQNPPAAAARSRPMPAT